MMSKKAWITLAVVLAVAVGCTTALRAHVQEERQPLEVMRAERFELVDKDGRVRAILESQTQERVGLYFLNEDGKRTAWFSADSNGSASLRILDNSGKINISLGTSKEGEAHVILSDGRGNGKVLLRAVPTGGEVTLLDAAGERAFKAPQ